MIVIGGHTRTSKKQLREIEKFWDSINFLAQFITILAFFKTRGTAYFTRNRSHHCAQGILLVIGLTTCAQGILLFLKYPLLCPCLNRSKFPPPGCPTNFDLVPPQALSRRSFFVTKYSLVAVWPSF